MKDIERIEGDDDMKEIEDSQIWLKVFLSYLNSVKQNKWIQVIFKR